MARGRLRGLLGQAAVLTTDWLAPAAAQPSGNPAVDLWPAGTDWDALRTPEWMGRPVLDQLLADGHDAALLGPVLWDRRAGYLYWLVAPGASDNYPDGARLLSHGSWLGAPICADVTAVRWRHLPAAEQLTPPAWLAVALWDQIRRTSNPRPGAAMSEPQPPEPDRCEMCTEPPSGSGPVLRVGPDDKNVDMGHEDCFPQARAAVRAARPAPARAS